MAKATNSSRFLLVLMLGLLAAAGLTACQTVEEAAVDPGQSAEGVVVQPDQPPEIVAGVSTSFGDGRPVEDLRFAAAYYTIDGELRLFDDPGRLVTHLAETGNEAATTWVADYETQTLIPAGEAVFVVSPLLVTPRGTGTLAVAALDRAQKLAIQNQGQVIALAALPAYYTAVTEFNALPQPSPGIEYGGLLIANGGK